MMTKHEMVSKRLFWHLLKEAAAAWAEDKASRLGAALAFYSVFSLGPLLLLIVTIAGSLFGVQDIKDELLARLHAIMGADNVKTVAAILDSAAHSAKEGVAAVVSLATLVLTGSAVIVQLKDALNDIWRVPANRESGWFSTVRSYVVATLVIFLLSLGVIASLFLTTAINVVDKYFIAYLPAPSLLLQVLNFLVSFVVEILLFAMMFKWLPDTRIKWREVIIGAVFTALLFELGKTGISVYLGRKALASTYGAAASVVGVMFWIYYSAQIVFFGAEFTKVHARHQRHDPRDGDQEAMFFRGSAL